MKAMVHTGIIITRKATDPRVSVLLVVWKKVGGVWKKVGGVSYFGNFDT